MKKHLLIVFLSLLIPGLVRADDCCEWIGNDIDLDLDCCQCKATSHTFYSIRPQFQVGSPEYESLFHDRRYACGKEYYGGAFQAAIFGGKSNAPARIATYLMPFCRAELSVNNLPPMNATTAFTVASQNLFAPYFNVVTNLPTFSSVIRFAPSQKVFGIGLGYKQHFARWNDHDLWLAISTPLTHVRNTVGFAERVINNGGGVVTTSALATAAGVVGTMTDAFKQPAWQYGRIDCDERLEKTRFADITVEFGFVSIEKECFHADAHIGALIPTGNTPEAVNVFEAIVGHNGHAGVTFGSNFGIQLWHRDAVDTSIWMEFNIQNIYLFSKNEVRLLDLKLKPWSRYMPVYANVAQAQLAVATGNPFLFTPGVNVFARDVSVTPALQRSYNSALLFNRCSWQVEVGYNFFARSAECVQLACPWMLGPALQAVETVGFTNSVQQINNPLIANNTPVALYNNNLIQPGDLDLESAAHPATLTHTFYLAFDHRWDEREHPLFLGLGGSYEFARENNLGMDRWAVWAKGGVSF